MGTQERVNNMLSKLSLMTTQNKIFHHLENSLNFCDGYSSLRRKKRTRRGRRRNKKRKNVLLNINTRFMGKMQSQKLLTIVSYFIFPSSFIP
jgi:hypothetical protein